jgi:hypothetical protein
MAHAPFRIRPVTPLTLFHTALSLIALLLGVTVVIALMNGRNPERVVAWFLGTSLLTTVTGFFFPFHGLTPAVGVGIVSCVVLAAAYTARYAFGRQRGWRAVDILALLATEYFLVFVGIAQSFQKVPALHALAPTGTETPFKIAQGVLVLALVIVATASLRARPPRSERQRPPIRAIR